MTKDDDRSINRSLPVRASFVLRCTLGVERPIVAQLLDVRTGHTYPFSDLKMLPGMLEKLLKPLVHQQEGDGTGDQV